ncbi:MAG TPA: efflux RND transporter permease subunit [Candidatus Polarisedimenticolia bacterium]|nr:efflux RND transporter permease subunit [Candidatus Polarisedimenticolia bacterium]
MNIARFAARNARAIVFGVVLVTLAGLYSITALPSGIYPEVEFPRIAIIAQSGDLSPRIMLIAVTRPLEEAARGVLGVRRVRSRTIRGATEISAIFNSDADMRYALQLMQAQIDEERQALPTGTQIRVERMTPSLFPMMTFNVTGDLPAADLRDIAMFQIRPLLTRVSGVARVDVQATDEREISVIVDPDKLSAAKLSLDQVSEALRNTNQVTSVGRLPKDFQQYLVLSTSEITTVEDVRHVVVAYRDQTPIYVGDLADVREGVVDRTTLITGNGRPASILSVARQIGGNIIAIADSVEQTLRDHAASLPSAVRISKVYDLAGFVRDAVWSVTEAIVIGGLLAVVVLLAFLHDWRATLVAATTLPLAIAGTFFILHLAGGTINLMSMGGLAIAIGLVIDDAIVVVESIHRHLAAGETSEVAAERGTNELVGAVIGSTLTTVVVFVPLGMLQGMVGEFFASLSLTLSGAVLLSLVYALLLIPVPAARFLKAQRSDGRSLGRLAGWYESSMRRVLERPRWVIAVTLGVAALGGLFYFGLQTGFLPEMDEGGYVIDYWTPPGTSLQESDRMVRGIEAIVKATPEVSGFNRRTGAEMGLFATEQNRGDVLVRLKPRSARSRDVDEIISEQRERFDREAPGMTIEFVQILQDMLGDLEGQPEPVEVKLFGDDLKTLEELAARIEAKMKRIPGLVDLVVPQRGNPELEVRIDPTATARAHLTAEEVSKQLAGGLLGEVATEVRRGDRLIDLRVRFPDVRRFDPIWVREYPLVTPDGATVPVSAVAEIASVEGASALHREDLKQMIPITGRLENRDMGSVVADVQKLLRAEKFPIGCTYAVGGQYESQQDSFRSLMLVLSIAVLLVFGLLVAQFRRLTAAIVILSAAPLSLVGAFGLLIATGTPLNLSSFMGLILLIGLIVKNGIILIDYADRLEAEGLERREALIRAGGIRLRPILMTTLCTLFGLLPLALGLGSGAELQKPLAIAVIGGLSVSTFITLAFVPTLLSILPPTKRSPEGSLLAAPLD